MAINSKRYNIMLFTRDNYEKFNCGGDGDPEETDPPKGDN